MPPFPSTIHCRPVVTAPFGDGVLALNADTGRFCHLNSPGALILDKLRDGVTRATLVADYTKRFGVDRGRAAGDIDSVVEQFWRESLLNEPPPSPGLQDIEAAPPAADPAMDRAVAIGRHAVRIVCERPDIAALVDAVTKPGRRSNGQVSSDLLLAGRGAPFGLYIDGRLEHRESDPAAARSTLLREALALSWRDARPAALLHASAVDIDGTCLVLAGPSGSGKTTLAAALVAAGGKLVADDMLAVSADGENLLPARLALSLKAGSWPLLATMFPNLAAEAVFRQRGIETRYLWPGYARTTDMPVPPAAILFMDRREGQEPGLTEVPPLETVDRLIRTGSQIRRPETGLAGFARFAEQCPAYSGRFDTLEEAILLVRHLCARTAAGR